jgi:hypothetical protein
LKRELDLESHKMNEGRKLDNEFSVKCLLWEKSQSNYNKPPPPPPPKVDNAKFAISVDGKPLVTTDEYGNKCLNRIKRVDENFTRIQSQV